jgi:hypothetical protein
MYGEAMAEDYESPSGGRVGESSLPVLKTFQGVEGGWAVTDAGESIFSSRPLLPLADMLVLYPQISEWTTSG